MELKLELTEGLRALEKEFGEPQAANTDKDALPESDEERVSLAHSARKLGITVAELRANPRKLAVIRMRHSAALRAQPLAAKACRLIMRAFNEGHLAGPAELWSELAASKPISAGDASAAWFFKSIIEKGLKKKFRTRFKSVGEHPLAVFDDCITACEILEELVDHGEPSSPKDRWSDEMLMWYIGEKLGCEAKARTVRKRLKQLGSDLKGTRRRYRVRLDTMDPTYRAKFERQNSVATTRQPTHRT